METVGGHLDNLKLKQPSEKGKEGMLLKNNQDGKVHRSGEDSTDAGPINNAPLVMDVKEMVRIVPTQEDQVQKEDSTDAGPSNKAPLVLDLKEMVRIVPTQEDQVQKEDSRDVEMKESEDSTDAVPSNRPTVMVSALPQSNPPLQERPQHKQEARTYPSSVTGPGPRPEDGARHGAEGNTVREATNLAEDKDLILYETAEQVAGGCDLRQMALRLRITESMVAQIEHDNPKLIPQFYQVFQLLSKNVPNSEEMFKKLLETMVKTNQGSTAKWLRERLGIREPEASLEGEASSPISDIIPQTEETGGNSDGQFYDIFLMHTGRSDGTKKFQSICKRHNWHMKTSDTIPAASPVHDAIERILSTSTHLALIITESDCINYKKHEMCLTVEMALQLGYNDGTLAGKVLPIRCCQKRSLPLVLQALTGAHIDEESFEERLVATIDTRTRLSRMREKQN